MENFSLERAAAERRLEAAFLLILPNEFGEIRPDLWRLVHMLCYESVNENFEVWFTSWLPLWLILAGMYCTS